MKIYTIIGGVNGCGKSSLTGAIKAERKDLGTIIDVDKINASFDGDKVAGGKKAIEKINHCIEQGLSFTQETTLSGARTATTAKKAKENGYYIRLYYVGLDSAQESVKRIQNRVAKGGHDIPKEDVLRRFNNRFEALKKILPYCNEALFFDNDNGFMEVAEYKYGELILKGYKHPKWIEKINDNLKYENQPL